MKNLKNLRSSRRIYGAYFSSYFLILDTIEYALWGSFYVRSQTIIRLYTYDRHDLTITIKWVFHVHGECFFEIMFDISELFPTSEKTYFRRISEDFSHSSLESISCFVTQDGDIEDRYITPRRR